MGCVHEHMHAQMCLGELGEYVSAENIKPNIYYDSSYVYANDVEEGVYSADELLLKKICRACHD